MTKPLCLFLLLVTCLAPACAQEDKPIITVLDFTVDEVSQAEMRSIINVLSSSLFNTDLFTVIDVSQRDNVLKEMEFSMSGCSDESCMLEIGKMLSAEGIVIGSIGRVGSKYVLSAKMIETETARTLSAADGIYQDLDELLEDISLLVLKLSRPYTVTAVVTAEPPDAAAKANITAIAALSGGIAAAILHDVGIRIAEEKYGSSDHHYQEQEGPAAARALLKRTDMTEEEIAEVCDIIGSHHTPGVIHTANFKSVYDADGLVNHAEKLSEMDEAHRNEYIESAFLTNAGKHHARMLM